MSKKSRNYNRHDLDDEDVRSYKKPTKGRDKINKYKKKIYNMATSLDLDDEAFDEYLDYEDLNYRRNKIK